MDIGKDMDIQAGIFGVICSVGFLGSLISQYLEAVPSLLPPVGVALDMAVCAAEGPVDDDVDDSVTEL